MKFVIFSDFDGTITVEDIIDFMIKKIHSETVMNNFNKKLFNNEITHDEYLIEAFSDKIYDIDYINDNFTNIFMDNKFKEFYDYSLRNGIDFYIISAGFKTIIKRMINYIPDANIFSNDVANIGGKMVVKLYDDKYGIDKQRLIKNYKLAHPEDKIIYLGDGISDFGVVNDVDILYVKRDSLLHQKCLSDGSGFMLFNDFSDMLENFPIHIQVYSEFGYL